MHIYQPTIKRLPDYWKLDWSSENGVVERGNKQTFGHKKFTEENDKSLAISHICFRWKAVIMLKASKANNNRLD